MNVDMHDLEQMHAGLSAAALAWQDSGDHRSDKSDPTPVPEYVIPRLTWMAAKIGFPVRYHPVVIPGLPDALGATNPGYCLGCQTLHPEKREIALLEMSPSSTARVLTHELTHAIEIGMMSEQELKQDVRQRVCGRPDPWCELRAESVAALVTGTLRCSDGRFSTGYLHRASGPSARRLEQVRLDAVDIADGILKLLDEK